MALRFTTSLVAGFTLSGCNAICGKQTWYADAGPRIEAWVLPIVLLLINIESGPFGKRSLLELLHVIGDPIDSLWSLLNKISIWQGCHTLAAQFGGLCPSCARIVATVLAGIEEIQGPRLKVQKGDLQELVRRNGLIGHFTAWRRAAIRLADSRTDELVRTILAFILFVYQLIDNWVPSIGGEPSSPAGSRICISVLLSCFIPHILLTNAVGGLASRRSAHIVMHDLAAETGQPAPHFENRESNFLPKSYTFARQSTSDFYQALAWSGGVYVFRPWKTNHKPWLHVVLTALLAATPVIAGMVAGCLLLWWQTPRGFNCRHIWLIGVSFLWMLSASFTTLSHNAKFMTGKYHWRFVLTKDAFVAIATLLMVFLEEVGLYNSCWCWSGPWEYPRQGRVMLPVEFYVSDGTVMYPMTLSAALLVQVLVFIFIICWWAGGMRLLRWPEEIRQEEFDLMLSGKERCGCISEMRKQHELS